MVTLATGHAWQIATTPTFYALLIIFSLSVGISPGYAGVRQLLLDHGVFSTHCASTVPCKEQESALDLAANLGLNMIDATRLPAGVLIDALGPRTMGVVGMAVWTVAMCLSGLSPASGVVWSVCFAVYNTASNLVFVPLILEYVPSLFSDQTTVAKASAVMTGGWDLGYGTFVIVTLLSNAMSASLFATTLTHGLVVGLPAVALLTMRFPPWSAHGSPTAIRSRDAKRDQLLSPAASDEDEDETATVSSCGSYWRPIARFLRSPLFWLLVWQEIGLVSYSTFFATNATRHASWHGASDEAAKQFNTTYSYFSIVGGFLGSFIVGALVDLTRVRSLVRILWMQSVLSVLNFAVSVAPSTPFEIQYITLAVFVIHRVNGYSFVNACFGAMFPASPALGTAFSLMSSVAGVVALGSGQVLGRAVDADVHNLWVAHGLLSVVMLGSEVVFAIWAPRFMTRACVCKVFHPQAEAHV